MDKIQEIYDKYQILREIVMDNTDTDVRTTVDELDKLWEIIRKL